jgi:hypothetical protein
MANENEKQERQRDQEQWVQFKRRSQVSVKEEVERTRRAATGASETGQGSKGTQREKAALTGLKHKQVDRSHRDQKPNRDYGQSPVHNLICHLKIMLHQ